MRYRHYIYPLIVFIVLWATSSLIAWNHRRLIRDTINTAGRNGEPIVVIPDSTQHFYSRSALLLSLNHGPIPIDLNTTTKPRSLVFKDNGMLYFSENIVMKEDSIFRSIRFPDYITKQVYQNMVQYSHSSINGSGPSRGEPYSTGMLFICDYGFLVADGVRGDIRTIVPAKGPPWGGDTYDIPQNFRFNMSPDGNFLFICRDNRDENSSATIWRHDIRAGTWNWVSDIEKVGTLFRLCIGRDGKIIAISANEDLQNADMWDCFNLIFLDGFTGEELHREPDAVECQIGQRWALCSSVSEPFPLVLLDMENGFAKTIIAEGKFGYNGFAIYEPPPNGLDGMYENYVPEDN